MSDDLVNQLTLNFLISKEQLQKLNKKVNKDTLHNKNIEIQKYSDRIKILCNDLLVCQPPDDLLVDVKTTFDIFIEKAIYYFNAHDNSHKEKHAEIHEDIDFDKEEKAIANGNYKEYEEEELEEELEEETNKSIDENNIQKLPLNWFENVRQNYKKNLIIPRKKCF